MYIYGNINKVEIKIILKVFQLSGVEGTARNSAPPSPVYPFICIEVSGPTVDRITHTVFVLKLYLLE